MKIEVLYFEGCPGFEELLPRLRAILHETSSRSEIELRRVETPQAAEIERFLGSPTVRVNGRDVDPSAGGRDDYGFKCRLYRYKGGVSPVPPDDWIRAGLAEH